MKQKTSKNTMQKPKEQTLTSRLVMLLELIYLLLGMILLLVPQIEICHICYTLSGILVVTGIFLIVRYFLTEGYRDLNEYGFSLGALFVLLGMCSLVKNEEMTRAFSTLLGICILFTAITKLQTALSLKLMDKKIWLAVLLLSVLMTVASMVIIIEPKTMWIDPKVFLDITLITDGTLGMLSILLLSVTVKKYNLLREEEEQYMGQVIERARQMEQQEEKSTEKTEEPDHTVRLEKEGEEDTSCHEPEAMKQETEEMERSDDTGV